MKRLLLLQLCLLLRGTVHAQTADTSFDPALAQQLQSTLDVARQQQGVQGISAAVTVEDQGLWSGVTGISGPSPAARITPEMRFGIASITKTFVAALTLTLAQEGVLTLDDSLHQWLPPLRNVDPSITIRQLLNHTSGVFNFFTHPSFWDQIRADLNHFWTSAEIFDTFVDPPYFRPGTGYHYGSTNYLLLGMIIKEATGDVAATFRRRFWEPLALPALYLSGEEVPTGPLATGWVDLNGDGVIDNASSWYAPALHSVRWTTGGALLNGRGSRSDGRGALQRTGVATHLHGADAHVRR